jgi:hypothetical protein
VRWHRSRYILDMANMEGSVDISVDIDKALAKTEVTEPARAAGSRAHGRRVLQQGLACPDISSVSSGI